MKKKPTISDDAAELRRRAEARLSERPRAQRSKAGDPKSNEADRQRQLHELEVHQIELEMQNEELAQARDRMQALLEKYTDLYDFAPVGYLTLDPQGTIQEANLTAASLLGIERSKLVNRRFCLFIDAEMRPDFIAFLGKASASGSKTICETMLQQEGKSPRWVWIEACGTVSGQKCRLAVVDVTLRKQAETDLARLERQVHAASERVQRRIGDSLHEDLCQRLAGIRAIATAMAMTLKAKARPESGRAEGIANELGRCLEQALGFAGLLQPVSLLEQGLPSALETLVFHEQKRSGIRFHFQREDLLPQIEIANATHLYRIAQEALDNAVRHAKASRIDIGLARRDGDLILTIADDGCGMAVPAGRGSGLGLQIMRYRSDFIGATLTIESKPRGGTVVTCCYPVAGSGRQSLAATEAERDTKNRLPRLPSEITRQKGGVPAERSSKVSP